MRPYHHGDLKDALLVAALEELAQAGAVAVSIRALAKRLGISPAAPYRHYKDRAALMTAMVVRGFDRLRSLASEADAAAEEGTAVAAQAIAYLRFADDNAELFRLMFGGLRVDPGGVASAEAAYEVLADRMRRDRADDPDLAARTLGAWSLMHGLALLRLDRQIDDKGAIEPLVTTVFGALGL